MNVFKKIVLLFALVVVGGGVMYAAAPSFDRNFANYLTDTTPDRYGRVETVFNICIDRNVSLMTNIRNIFYPHAVSPWSACDIPTEKWWQLWSLIRSIGFVILFVFLVLAGIKLIMNAKEPDGTKKAFTSLLYILYGAFLFFWVTWILGTVLNIWDLQWSAQLVDRVQNRLFFQILSFFKVLAFFAAIIMLVVSGFRMMAAMDKSDKIAVARKGGINVLIALVFIKIIDYVFFIAQTPEFGSRATDMIVNVAITLWWVLWSLFVLAIFYSGYTMIVSWWKEDSFKKARWIIVNIFIVALVIFLFLLLVYQIFKEFA